MVLVLDGGRLAAGAVQEVCHAIQRPLEVQILDALQLLLAQQPPQQLRAPKQRGIDYNED